MKSGPVRDRPEGGFMSKRHSRQTGTMSGPLLAAGLLASVATGAVPALAQQAPPDFSTKGVAWVSVGGEWTPQPGSPPTVTQDPAHRYVPNNTGGQPTFRIANINNPNLTVFAKD